METKNNKWLNAIMILSVILLLISVGGIILSVVYLIGGANIAVYGLIISLWVMMMGVVSFIIACYWQTKLLANPNAFGVKKFIVEKYKDESSR